MKIPRFFKRCVQKVDPYFRLANDLQTQSERIVAEYQALLESAQQENTARQQETKDLQATIAKYQALLESAQQENTARQQETKDLQATIAKDQALLKNAQQEICSIKEAASNYQTLLASAQQEINAHKETIAKYQTLLQNAQQEINAHKETIAKYQTLLQNAQTEIVERKRELSAKDAEIDHLKQEMIDRNATYRTSLKKLLKDPSIRQERVCKICDRPVEFSFTKRIMGKYDVSYFYCPHCEHLQTEDPYWLEEAYNSALSDSDTGLVWRNERNREIVGAVLQRFFPPTAKVLEYAGGYGLLTRMLRDAGAECFWYDKYATNTFARRFEDNGKRRYDLVLAFEALEHFADPMEEFGRIFNRGGSLLFSEELLTEPCPDQWWYLCTEHGQHLNFYSLKTLQYVAEHFHKKLYFHENVGLMTSLELKQENFDQIFDHTAENFRLFQESHAPLTVSDMNAVIQEMQR